MSGQLEFGKTAGSLRAAIGNAKRTAPKSTAILVPIRDAEVLARDKGLSHCVGLRVHGLQVIPEPRLKPGQFALLKQLPRPGEEVGLT